MAKAIVIVESPTKVKTINKILGSKYKVVSSMGHLIDLPKSTLGVDIDDDFKPKLIVMRAKSKHMTKLKKDSKKMTEIYVATDPDREGEAIGFNIINHLGEGKKIFRVEFQEITKEAVLRAFKNAREFDMNLINAQIARRILDRIVGYSISPILWKKVGSRLSAGRVQSVALKLIVDREKKIKAFNPVEYWSISADLKKGENGSVLNANLEKIDNEKFEIGSQKVTDDTVDQIKKEEFVVSAINTKSVKRNPGPPLITSTMQQESFNKLKFNANRTMMIAQQLYEGIDLGNGETVGLITYMRTDSVNIANEALEKLRSFITDSYGKEYLPDTPNKYKSKKSAQEAHEAIRPSDVNRKPEDLRKYLTDEQYKLYTLIWNRFVGSQVVQAVYEQKKMVIDAGKFRFGASGSTLMFDGYLVVDRSYQEEEQKLDFTDYTKGDKLNLIEVLPVQHFTKPPPRFSDASLVKALEEDGIGRPSTYASIISTLVLRHYINRDGGYFTPTELGILICDLLVENFKVIMDLNFTATLEEKLDKVEEGVLKYPDLLKEFYQPFKKELDHAEATIQKTENFIDKYCKECKKQMIVKWGRRGKFISCSGFPECTYSEAFTSGVKCPEEGCEGELVQRRSRRGPFYGCSKYPECTYTSRKLPEETENSEKTEDSEKE